MVAQPNDQKDVRSDNICLASTRSPTLQLERFSDMFLSIYLRLPVCLCLKALVVGGIERVFEIGRQFRNEGKTVGVV